MMNFVFNNGIYNNSGLVSKNNSIFLQCDPASGSWRDCLGFPVSESMLPLLQDWTKMYETSLKIQGKRWDDFLARHDLTDDLERCQPISCLSRSVRRQLKGLSRIGVPHHMRPIVWRKCISPRIRQRAGGLSYNELLARYKGRPSAWSLQLEKDMHRTFPDHPMFYFEEGRNALFRILETYSHFNPTVGYCQSMNFVGGVLLLAVHSEEDAFWLLSTLVEELLPGYYLPSLIGVQVDSHMFQDLLSIKLPRIYRHLQTLDLDEGALISTWAAWFMCVMVNFLPTESVLRLWDSLLLSGSGVKPLLQVALAIIKGNEPLLLSAESGEDVLQLLTQSARNFVDCDSLMSKAFDDSLGNSLISRLRTFYGRKIISGDRIFEVFVKTSDCLRRINAGAEETTRKCLCSVGYNSTVWSGDDEGCICVWDADAGCLIHKTLGLKGRRICAIADVGLEIWVTSAGGTITRFDPQSFEKKGEIGKHTSDVHAVACSGDTVWTGARDQICVWVITVEEPQLYKEIFTPGHEILCLSISHDRNQLYCGTHSSLLIFNANNWEYSTIREINMSFAGGCTDVTQVLTTFNVNRQDKAVLTDGDDDDSEAEDAELSAVVQSQIWCIHGNSEIGIWDTETFRGQSMHKGHGAVCKLLALPNNQVWTAAGDGSVLVWNAKTRKVMREIRVDDAPISDMVGVCNRALGVLTVWCASYEGRVCIWVVEDLKRNGRDHDGLSVDMTITNLTNTSMMLMAGGAAASNANNHNLNNNNSDNTMHTCVLM